MPTLKVGNREMLIDEADMHLFDGIKLWPFKNRNATYAFSSGRIAAHRLIMGVTDRSLVVDHINGDGLDNRRGNLRVVTVSVNSKNRRVSRSKTAGMLPGMWPYRDRIAVQISNDGKKIFVGYFLNFEEAHQALNVARLKLGRPPV
ncbi:HNH endonuclease [Polaromonas sp. OV174]|uniref:HNH endonuclease n=1 Tax=Polaromonas sp. OV174 TaxID=1855300 RepID=UPI000B86CDBF|nr:HNH endonuclease [Polaromonas sp. OV174]